MASNHIEVPSAAFFNPQSKAADIEYLNSLPVYLQNHAWLRGFVEAIRSLPQTRQTLAHHSPEIATLKQGSAAAKALAKWMETSDSSTIANGMSGSLTLPLLTIIQICQYFQYLDIKRIQHSELLQLVQEGGVHGYCGGMLPAVAVAVSANERELVENASTALRLAFAIGIYGDLGDGDLDSGPTNMVIRLKRAGQGEEFIRSFPGAYISAVTDPKTISIVGPAQVLKDIKAYSNAQGLLSQGVHIRGKVHNPENEALAVELDEFCNTRDDFRFPSASRLCVSLRSNVDGSRFVKGPLTHEVIKTILSTCCDWYSLLQEVAADLERSGRVSHHLINFGIGDCLSPVPFHQRGLSMTKAEARNMIKEAGMKSSCVQAGAYEYPLKAVAVVGMACRYPGANNVEELWKIISSGTSVVKELPQERIDTQKNFRISQGQPPVNQKKFYGNFMDRPDAFDHAFFGINPREASYMDPQQRLLLETSFQAVESSGYLCEGRRGQGDNVGVFIGASCVEYLSNTSSHAPTAYNSVGTLKAFLCGRISHYFGWTGSAEIIDTACSSSLVAINRACKAIQSGECVMALAGGVNVMSSIDNFLDLGKAGFLSPTGQCKPFDKDADGYCRSEGAGMLFLKPLDQALQQDDQILGVICGAATNQGGLSPSITIPHSPSQVTLYHTLLDQAGMTPDQVSYVEAHGTGTQVGDPLEIASIREVFGGPKRDTLLHVGSLKGNIGHAETAAGVAGCIKALLLLQKGQIPPLASHTSLNSKIPDLKSDQMAITPRQISWDAPFRAVCANSYGAAGSNAAVLLCQPPPRSPLGHERHHRSNETWPFLLSAESKPSLMAYATDLKTYLEGPGSCTATANVAYTLTEKRQHHRFRMVTVGSLTDLTRALGDGSIEVSESPPVTRRVVLIFPGQISQVIGMNPALYDSCALLRSHLSRCNEIVTGLGISGLIPSLFQTQPISNLKVLHCCLFAQQYACARSWIESGLCVDAVVGQSFGELTALAVSGILSLEDAVALVAHRASLIESQWGPDCGAMLTVRCSMNMAEQLLLDTKHAGQAIEIACFNADESLVLGGTKDAVAAAERVLQDDFKYRAVKASRLEITHAYHTALTENILEDLESFASSLEFKKPTIPFEACTKENRNLITPKHIRDHVRNPVFFQNAIRRLEQRLGSCVWLEAGSDSPAFSILKRAVASPQDHFFHPIKIGKSGDPVRPLCDATANLWRAGISVSYWNFQSPAEAGLRQVWLPPYHFQETRHWLPYVDHAMEALEARQTSDKTRNRTMEQATLEVPQLIRQIRSSAEEAAFEIDPRHPRFVDIVAGHAVLARPLCPAGMYLECAILAAQLNFDGQTQSHSIGFEDCSFESPLGLSADQGTITMRLHKSLGQSRWSFSMSSSLKRQSRKQPAVHAKGHIDLVNDVRMDEWQRLVSRRVGELQKNKDLETLRKDKVYRLFSRVVDYSEIFRGISVMRFADSEAVAEVNLSCQPSESSTSVGCGCDAISLDIFLQVCGLLINSHDNCPSDAAYLAVGTDFLSIAPSSQNKPTAAYTVYATFEPVRDNHTKGDVFVLHENQVVVVMTGVRFAKVPLTTLAKLLDTSKQQAKHEVEDLKGVAGSPNDGPYLPNGDTHYVETSSNRGSGSTASDTNSSDLHKLGGIIASYTGIPHDQITEHTSLNSLGVDSLAAIELAEELLTQFGAQIPSTSLLEGTFRTLCDRLGLRNKATAEISHLKPRETATSNTAEGFSQQLRITPSSNDTRSTVRQRLAEIVALHSGHPPSGVSDMASLTDLGVDSLARIELKGDIEAAFHLNMADEVLSESTTIMDLLNYLTPDSKQPNLVAHGDSSSSSPSSLTATTTPESFDALQEPQLDIDPIQILAEINAFFPSSAEKHSFTGFWGHMGRELDRLVLAYILEALHRLGCDMSTLMTNEPIPHFKHLSRHDQLVARLWAILERFDLVWRDGKEYVRTTKSLPSLDSAQQFSQLLTNLSVYEVDLSLLALTGPELANCLTGSADPLKLLFGTSKAQQILSNFYHKSPMFATMTDQLLLFVKRIIEHAGSNGIRILEVGAGFGGTTATLAKLLQESGCKVEYTFTDVAPTLVDKARKTFSEYSWMNFATLDLEQDPPAALRGKYDMVIATNVVHATSNLVASTRRIKSILRDGGFMCLSEITKIIEWHNLVFGLLPGWWCFNDGRSYALQSAEEWMEVFRKAGFKAVSYSRGPSAEAESQQLLIGSTKTCKQADPPPARLNGGSRVHTVVYKTIDDTDIHADIYLPNEAPKHPMPIALMIHGGGYMTLSKSAIRPAQTRFLLSKGVLPISLDHRLCPEVSIIDGPMSDIRDAVAWARSALPRIAVNQGLTVDTDNVAVIGWSTGGHLAMTTAWTTAEAGIAPPSVILNFYGASDFKALGRTLSTARIRASLSPKPYTSFLLIRRQITSYQLASSTSENALLGWLVPGDPRSELVLSLFKEAHGLSLLLNGPSALSTLDGLDNPGDDNSSMPCVSKEQLAAINPLVQLQQGNYNVPTFFIHGSEDEVVPCEMSVAFERALRARGVASGICVVKGKGHVCDLGIEVGSQAWERGPGKGYEFLLEHLSLEA
ncbi:MAG: hypothetical protein Q9184_004954 [Pyrenodesmia sp. 2 TL-2023]